MSNAYSVPTKICFAADILFYKALDRIKLGLLLIVNINCYFSSKTLSSIFNIEMVKDKTAEEIKQVMNENE